MVKFGDVMSAIELDFRDFPADVQDLLKTRAIRERKSIGQVVSEYVVEIAREIVAKAS